MVRSMLTLAVWSACACDVPPYAADEGLVLDAAADAASSASPIADMELVVSTDSYLDFGPWRFVAISDSHGYDNGINSTVFAEIADEIVAQQAEVLIFAGDLVSGGGGQAVEAQIEHWQDTLSPVYGAGIGVYPVRGNHEVSGLEGWHNAFLGIYSLPLNGPEDELSLTYSVVYKNARFIGLDAFKSYGKINQDWLDEQLANNLAPHIFSYAHYPAFPAITTGGLDGKPKARDKFWRSLAEAGSRVYFCGHGHFFDHARLDDGDGDPDNDVHQMHVGTSGAGLYGWEPTFEGDLGDWTVDHLFHAVEFGYVVGDVDGLAVTLTFWRRDEPGVYNARYSWSYVLDGD
jgi:hypothetical protein